MKSSRLVVCTEPSMKSIQIAKTVILDVDGVYLTLELSGQTVLPVSEGISATATEGASSDVRFSHRRIIIKEEARASFCGKWDCMMKESPAGSKIEARVPILWGFMV